VSQSVEKFSNASNYIEDVQSVAQNVQYFTRDKTFFKFHRI